MGTEPYEALEREHFSGFVPSAAAKNRIISTLEPLSRLDVQMKILILSQFSDIIENELPKCDDQILYVKEFRDFDLHRAYDDYDFDVLICFGYGRVLPVAHPRFASVRFINLHTSLLPYGRGLNPNLSSWLNSEPHGVTIHEMDGSYDTGGIIFQKCLEFDIEVETLRSSYYKKLLAAIELLTEKWNDLIIGNYVTKAQDTNSGSLMTLESLRTYAPVLAAYNDQPLTEFLAAVAKGRIESVMHPGGFHKF